MDQAAAHLLDFNQPLDITLLEQIVEIAYDSGHPMRSKANEFLVKMKEHPEMWKRADAILETSTQPYTKFFGYGHMS
jgi:exportin-1